MKHTTPYEAQYYFPGDISEERVPLSRWEFLEGEKEILPGLRVVPVPGHSRGSQCVLLDTEEGILCFSGDTITSHVNVENNRQPSIVVNDLQLWESIERIYRMADRIVFSHDEEITAGMRSGFYKMKE